MSNETRAQLIQAVMNRVDEARMATRAAAHTSANLRRVRAAWRPDSLSCETALDNARREEYRQRSLWREYDDKLQEALQEAYELWPNDNVLEDF